MKILKPGPSNLAEWYALIQEAERELGYRCDEHVQSYLMLTLDQYTTDSSLVSAVLAMDFLRAPQELENKKMDILRTTGDRCLLLAGLFPERATKKNVSINYFIELGQQSYYIVSESKLARYSSRLFYTLCVEFNVLQKLLAMMRHTHLEKWQ